MAKKKGKGSYLNQGIDQKKLWAHLELLKGISRTPAWALWFSDGSNGFGDTFEMAVHQACQRADIMKMNPEFCAAIEAAMKA